MVLSRAKWQRIRPKRVVSVLLVLAFLSVAARALFPTLIEPRVDFLTRSLNPFSQTSELSTRPNIYLSAVSDSVGYGGLFGRGVGDQSLGRQYILGGNSNAVGEGGFSTIAVETGIVGLVVWIWWTGSWSLRLLRLRRRVAPEHFMTVSAIAFGTTFVLFVKFWLGISAVQDYVLNAGLFFGWGVAVGLVAKSENGTSGLTGPPPHDLIVQRSEL
jgi:cell division protein FtsW (lipid II flippase)